MRIEERGRLYVVLGAEGNPVGQVGPPAGAVVMVADLENGWTLENDDLGMPSVVRYRIPWD